MTIKENTLPIKVVLNHICTLGEGPVWDEQQQIICWVDIIKGEIHEFSPKQNMHKTTPVHQMVGAISICNNGGFLAALQEGFGFIDRKTGEIKMITDPETHLPNNRFNDGKCDPTGRFWAGTMSLSEEPKAGSVYVFEKDFTVIQKIEGTTISNGMAWSLDHQTFYFIDTPTFEVVAYDFDKSSGQISHKRTVIKTEPQDGHPDGMTIDNEGMLWIAHWDGWQVTRWNPVTGEKIYRIALPVARVTSCTFGGENLDDLYITSAKIDLTDEELQKQPLAGSLFVLPHCGFQGLPAHKFNG